jgi:AbrB family looped-hinge helix DNA binding protein
MIFKGLEIWKGVTVVTKTIQVRGHGQITLPKKIRERFQLEEGDLLVIEACEDGILMKPRKLLDPTQAWFWTKEWQEKERQAEEDIKAGRVSGPFKGVEELKKHLEQLKA